MLGGSSSINAMVYMRGNRVDYDGWHGRGCAGWSWADMLPCFLRAEDNERGANEFHGVGGPLAVSDLRHRSPISERARFAEFQRTQLGSAVVSLGADVGAWRRATDKYLSVLRFARDGIPHMETIALTGWDPRVVREAFERLGRDVWSRPSIGAGGTDVFHLTTLDQLDTAHRHYYATNQDEDWLLSRDARNIGSDGRRY